MSLWKNIDPLDDRVVVRRSDKKKEKTEGGIYIPDNAQEAPSEGVVLRVGPGTRDKKPAVTHGDRVLFGKYAGSVLDVDGEDGLLIMRESEILAIVR